MLAELELADMASKYLVTSQNMGDLTCQSANVDLSTMHTSLGLQIATGKFEWGMAGERA